MFDTLVLSVSSSEVMMEEGAEENGEGGGEGVTFGEGGGEDGGVDGDDDGGDGKSCDDISYELQLDCSSCEWDSRVLYEFLESFLDEASFPMTYILENA